MSAIEVIVPKEAPRGWHGLLVERLRADGHDVAVRHRREGRRWPATMRAALALERRLLRRPAAGLATPLAPIPETPAGGRAAGLRIDLSGENAPAGAPVLRLAFDGSRRDAAIIAALARGRLPEIEATLDGQPVGRARPMIDRRESVALAADDVFARAVTLLRALTRRFAQGGLPPAPTAATPAPSNKSGFSAPYLGRALPRLAREAARRARYRQAHWRVGYRFVDGAGVAATGRLGTGWSVIPDDGTHFYADPFAFEWQGRHHVFVEDFPHATGKAVISLVTFDAAGRPSVPAPVLEEDHHLSYPQVFARDGEIWMLPEGSASGRLTLYRATGFPREWTADCVLVEGREISDATLLEHDGRLWLFATERDGYGSTSDTMVVYHAQALKGPWTPHPMNPLAIDRRAARPGGAVAEAGGRLLLPLQDGTLGYGGGLGLAEILRLDAQAVRLGEPKALSTDGDFPHPMVHTLNRAGRLEVVDGIVAVRR